MRSNIKKVFWFYFLLFLTMIIYLLKFSLIDSKNIVGNSYNPRVNSSINPNIKRGAILDKNLNVLAETKNKRIYPYKNIFAHTVGFLYNGSSGVEARYSIELKKLQNPIIDNAKKLLDEDYIMQANSVVLTLDKDIQTFCYNKLKNKKGAILVLNSKNGKILSMVSIPNFDPNNIKNNWDNLTKNDNNNALLNRATQGLYPPASIFKILTAITFIENYPDWKNYKYTCKGYENFSDITITCFDKQKHGEITLENALAHSCNSFFINLYKYITPSDLEVTAQKLLFNKPLNFDLDYKKSIFSLKDNSPIDEIMQTYIGQGKTLVTPLHIALIGSAIANEGVIMTPIILDSIIDENGKIVKTTKPKILSNTLSKETANTMKTLLESVTNYGTAKKIKIKDLSISAKTGTAQVFGEKDHTWFLGILPIEDNNIVICTFFENSGAKSDIINISKDIINYIIQNKNTLLK